MIICSKIMKNKIDSQYIFNLFVSFLTASFIFFWSIENPIINLRYLILLLIFPTAISAIYNIKDKNYFFIINFLLISFFLIFHLIINQLILEEDIKISTFYGLVFFLLIYAILYFHSFKIVQNLELIVYIFLLHIFWFFLKLEEQ